MPPLSYRSAELLMVWSAGLIWLVAVAFLVRFFLPTQPLAGAGLFALATIFPPTLFTLSLGQVNIYIFLMVLLMVGSLIKRWDSLAGILLGLSIISKTHLGLFVLYFLVKRRTKATLAAIITLAALVVFSIATLGLSPWRTYLNSILPAALGGMVYIANQSCPGVLARIFISDPQLLFTDSLLPSGTTLYLFTKAAALLIVAATLWVVAPARGPRRIATEASAIILALLLATPVANLHHFVWVYLPLAVLWSALLQGNRDRFQAVLLSLGTILLFLPWPTFFGLFLGHCGWPRLFACNTFLGTLLLWIAALRLIRSAPRLSSSATTARGEPA